MANSKNSVPIAEIQSAVQHRDVPFILSNFFTGKPPRLNEAYRYESELWDYKGGCPGHGEQNAWAQIAADVLAFYNTSGGVLFFGIADGVYSYCGTKTPFDAKQFNDKIRKYTGDKFWVTYCKAFQDDSGRYLGVAIIPKRGLQVIPFFADSPLFDGGHYFQAGDIAVRVGDETRILRGEKAAEHLSQLHIPASDAYFLVNEPSYRVLRPDWDEFVPRDSLCDAVIDGLRDERTFVTSLTGIGGVGKTALACWGVLHAYEEKWFEFITSISAKDRALTSSGISEVTATGSSLNQLLDSLLEVIGFSELISVPEKQKEKEVREILKGTEALLLVDNLETVQDEALINFLDNLPVPVKAILTSRKSRVRKAVFPIEVGQFEQKEAITFLDLVAAKKGRGFIPDMNLQERQLIVESCYRIPLVIEWFVGIAKDAATAVELARKLELSPRQSEELLEFCFRRVHTDLGLEARKILKVLSMFTEPQPIEALHAACSMPMDTVSTGLDELFDTSLVVKTYNPRLRDTTFGMLPITRRFAYAELQKEAGLEQTLRRALSVWYEGTDIADPDQRKIVVQVRQGKRDVDTLLVDAAKQLRNDGKFGEAEDFLLQAAQRNPNSWRAMRESGDFYKHDKKIARALEFYSKAAKLAPKKGKDRALIFREYGILLRDAGTPDALKDAANALEEALKETPNDPVCLYVLAQVLCRRDMYLKAEPLLERLISSQDQKSRIKAYPLLRKCYEYDHDTLKLNDLRSMAKKDNFNV